MPWKYQSLPLSATITPYAFIARRMTLASGLNLASEKPTLRRKRAPIGGHLQPPVEASWRAGHRYFAEVHDPVTRIAWSTSPAATSS